MNELEIKTFATWETSVGLLGNFKTPLILLIEVHNKTSCDITIDSICISIKKNYLLFSASSDELKQSKNYVIRGNSKFKFKLDVRHLFERYSTSKKFKIKVTSNTKVFESDMVSIGALKSISDI